MTDEHFRDLWENAVDNDEAEEIDSQSGLYIFKNENDQIFINISKLRTLFEYIFF